VGDMSKRRSRMRRAASAAVLAAMLAPSPGFAGDKVTMKLDKLKTFDSATVFFSKMNAGKQAGSGRIMLNDLFKSKPVMEKKTQPVNMLPAVGTFLKQAPKIVTMEKLTHPAPGVQIVEETAETQRAAIQNRLDSALMSCGSGGSGDACPSRLKGYENQLKELNGAKETPGSATVVGNTGQASGQMRPLGSGAADASAADSAALSENGVQTLGKRLTVRVGENSKGIPQQDIYFSQYGNGKVTIGVKGADAHVTADMSENPRFRPHYTIEDPSVPNRRIEVRGDSWSIPQSAEEVAGSEGAGAPKTAITRPGSSVRPFVRTAFSATGQTIVADVATGALMVIGATKGASKGAPNNTAAKELGTIAGVATGVGLTLVAPAVGPETVLAIPTASALAAGITSNAVDKYGIPVANAARKGRDSARSFVEPVANAIEKAGASIQKEADKIREPVKSVVEPVMDAVENTGRQIEKKANDIREPIKKKVEPVMKEIDKACDNFEKDVNVVRNEINKAIDTAVDTIKDVATDAWNAFKGMFGGGKK